jgi:hypothetical protein
MKYLKLFESLNDQPVKGYEGKILINKPSQNYFRSSINYQVIFVDHVLLKYSNERLSSEQPLVYTVKSDYTIQINADFSLTYTDWNQDYVSWEFDKLNFMTPKEFYEKHTESFIRLLEETIKESKNKLNKTDWFKKKINDIIDKLTIPETEHIISAEKYNL